MSDPFHIDGPAYISFSGGRTSGYMLWRALRAHGGTFPDDVRVLFANTGKEREETLSFVRDCAVAWGVTVHWVERTAGGGLCEVNHETASRRGEPYTALIRDRRFLPNPVMRFCTTELKIRPMGKWMLAQGYEHWTNAVGIRADEPRRIAKYKERTSKERLDVVLPLATAGITKENVRAFWREQPFDLALRDWEGNCDLCFLKGRAKKERIMRDRPDLAPWWIGEEDWARVNLKEPDKHEAWGFRSDSPSYAGMFRIVQATPMLIPDEPISDLDDLGDCECDLEAA